MPTNKSHTVEGKRKVFWWQALDETIDGLHIHTVAATAGADALGYALCGDRNNQRRLQADEDGMIEVDG